MIGLQYPWNFNHPYWSTSITDFWRRWHITLSQWFRDYVYIPLGGNRGSRSRTYLNLLIVFLLCGIWHGAGWTFVVWGLLHGAFLMFERAGLRADSETYAASFVPRLHYSGRNARLGPISVRDLSPGAASSSCHGGTGGALRIRSTD